MTNSKKMVEVPLANGKVGELPEGTLVEPCFLSRKSVDDPVYVAEHGYRHRRDSRMIYSWDRLHVVRVFEETDLPEPKSKLPKGIGAVLRSKDSDEYTLTRISPTQWVDNTGEKITEDRAKEIIAWDRFYVASEGVDLDRGSPIEPGDE